jgi:hypothetical protein
VSKSVSHSNSETRRSDSDVNDVLQRLQLEPQLHLLLGICFMTLLVKMEVLHVLMFALRITKTLALAVQ